MLLQGLWTARTQILLVWRTEIRLKSGVGSGVGWGCNSVHLAALPCYGQSTEAA
jgi:hypothetical protein